MRTRPVLLVLGEPGTGKTAVARRILGQAVIRLGGDALREACAKAVRRGRWPDELREAEGVILDGPTYLSRRPGVVRLLSLLLVERTEAGRRTVICQGNADDTVALLLDAVEPKQRVTITLRFPMGRGRVRFAKRMCRRFGIPLSEARQLEISEPWTYRKVLRAVRAVRRETETEVDG